jgi:hypothetical protein
MADILRDNRQNRMTIITKFLSIIFIHTGKLHLNASSNTILELRNSTKAVTQLIIKHSTCDKTRKFIIAFPKTSHLTGVYYIPTSVQIIRVNSY